MTENAMATLSPALRVAVAKFEAGFSAVSATAFSEAKITFIVTTSAAAIIAILKYTAKGSGAFPEGLDDINLDLANPEVGTGASFFFAVLVFVLLRILFLEEIR